ncbi:MAG: NUDIX domain-containing protein [Candidatus Moranbacteria bacterium]|jgi:mutator protein MutT|nr:NUDIX domain-containing protein [Candidatus Moranbacteria bacterium]
MENIRCKNNFDEIVDVPKEKFFFRPSAYAIIKKGDEIVMLRNKGNGKLWLPGGGIEIGEKIEDGLKREIREEIGIDVEVGRFLLMKENFFYYQPLDEAYHAFLFFYQCEYISGELKKESDDLESKNPQWVKIQDIKKEDLSDMKDDIFKLLNS